MKVFKCGRFAFAICDYAFIFCSLFLCYSAAPCYILMCAFTSHYLIYFNKICELKNKKPNKAHIYSCQILSL